jgi:hypothetical protein
MIGVAIYNSLIKIDYKKYKILEVIETDICGVQKVKAYYIEYQTSFLGYVMWKRYWREKDKMLSSWFDTKEELIESYKEYTVTRTSREINKTICN